MCSSCYKPSRAGVSGRVRATAPRHTIKHWIVFPLDQEILDPQSPLARDVLKVTPHDPSMFALGGVEVLSEDTYVSAFCPAPKAKPFAWYHGANA